METEWVKGVRQERGRGWHSLGEEGCSLGSGTQEWEKGEGRAGVGGQLESMGLSAQHPRIMRRQGARETVWPGSRRDLSILHDDKGLGPVQDFHGNLLLIPWVHITSQKDLGKKAGKE